MAVRVLAALFAVLVLWSYDPLTVTMDTRLTDVTQARATGGMIALFPRADDAAALTVAGGEPAEELHLTLVDFGPDVTGRTDDELSRRLGELMTRWTTEIKADVFGHATFNPRTPGECAVYLIGDSPELAELRFAVIDAAAQVYQVPPQRDPWIPHITADYGTVDNALAYTGPVVFDRVELRWAGHITAFPLHTAA